LTYRETLALEQVKANGELPAAAGAAQGKGFAEYCEAVPNYKYNLQTLIILFKKAISRRLKIRLMAWNE